MSNLLEGSSEALDDLAWLDGCLVALWMELGV
jgi:hypothetical protein